jgi:hypothetical protein
MRRRRLLLGAGLFLLLELTGLYIWRNWPEPGAMPENFLRLRRGMTRREVEAIFGEPGTFGGRIEVGYPITEWRSGLGTAFVEFDSSVDRTHAGWFRFDDGRPSLSFPGASPSFLDRLRRMFPW